jgi:hypothetical protein
VPVDSRYYNYDLFKKRSCRAAFSANPAVLLLAILDPKIHFLFGFVLCLSVAFLNLASELLGIARNDVEIVVRELTPLPLNFTLHLRPFTLHFIRVHMTSLSAVAC